MALAPRRPFVFGAVDGDHGGVEEALVGGVDADELGREDGFDVVDRGENAFAEVVRLVAVAELDGFVLAGGCAGRNGGAAHGSAGEQDVGFDGGIAAGVEDFAGGDGDDVGRGGHGVGFPLGLGGAGDAVGEAVVEPGPAVYGNRCAGGACNGGEEAVRFTRH